MIDTIRVNTAKNYLNPHQRLLLEDIKQVLDSPAFSRLPLSDYSFIVAPAAKAYEGYLKDFFLRIKIIDKNTYHSNRFRVGKTLNPSLRYKRFSIFQRLSTLHETGERLAETLWDAWKYGRNEIFHYFPSESKNIDLSEAIRRINLILTAIEQSGKFCDQLEEEGFI